MQEIWKDIPNYEGLYQISNKGRVKNTKTNKILSTYLSSYKNDNHTKYYKVDLSKNKKKKKYYIHRLMAITFLNLNSDSKFQVDHKNDNSFDNNINNLQILTQEQNLKKQMELMKKNIDLYKNNIIKNMFLWEYKIEK